MGERAGHSMGTITHQWDLSQPVTMVFSVRTQRLQRLLYRNFTETLMFPKPVSMMTAAVCSGGSYFSRQKCVFVKMDAHVAMEKKP